MEKILIIQLCRLGDVVQTLPLVMRLKEVKKGSHISFVCRKEYSGIVPCSYGVDRLIYPSHEFLGQIEKQPKDALRIIPELEEEYDYVINLTANPIAGRICQAVKAQRKSGRIITDNGESIILGDFAKYYFSFSDNRLQNLFNIVDMYIGMGDVSHHPVHGYIRIGEREYEGAERLMRQNGYKKHGKLIALQLGANKLHRAWPIEKYALLADQLAHEYNAEIVLLGIEEERKLASTFQKLSNTAVIDLTGKTGLSDLAAVLNIVVF